MPKNISMPFLPKLILSATIFLSSGMFFAQETDYSRPEIATQIELLFEKAEMVIPEVDLTENISFSDSTGVISNSIVFHSKSDTKLNPGYYYWYDNMWNPLSNSLKEYELLILWELDSKEFSYADIDESILTFGIGGIEDAELKQIKGEKTLVYQAIGGKDLIVDFNEVIGTKEVVKTFTLRRKIVSFYDNGVIKRINFERAPKKNEISVLSSKFHLIAVTPVNPEILMESHDFSSGKQDDSRGLGREGNKEIVQPEKKVREGREIKSIEDNEDGTFTIFYADGSRFTSLDLKNPKVDKERELINVINNGDGTFVALFSDGTSLSSKELHDFYNFEGYAAGETPEVDVVIDNGDGTYDVILTNGVELNALDFATISKSDEPEEDGRGILSVINKEDGSFDVIFTDGTEINSKDLSDLEEYDVSAFLPDLEGSDNMDDSIEKRNEVDGDDVLDSEKPEKRGIRNIVKQEDGTSKVVLTDGTTFSVPDLKLEAESSGPDTRIEELIDNKDGTYTIILSGGVKLSSLDIPNLDTNSVEKKVESINANRVESRDNELNSTGTDLDFHEKEQIEDKPESVKIPNTNEKVVPVTPRSEKTEKGSKVNASESDGSKEGYQERIIRIQREEIEALKKREEEKEKELQEMNQRLKRLEDHFGQD